jgi:hypothetical protein
MSLQNEQIMIWWWLKWTQTYKNIEENISFLSSLVVNENGQMNAMIKNMEKTLWSLIAESCYI